MHDEPLTRKPDVIVVGGGLSGLAASIHLVKAGLNVVCLEPRTSFDHIVGESLDWSAPRLFSDLGLQMEQMVSEGVATFKRHVILKLQDGSIAEYVPGAWLGAPPFNIELRTLHVDRVLLHKHLLALAISLGVEIAHDTAESVECERERITSIRTASGLRFSSPWFVDASGSAASFLARSFALPVTEYGLRKVAMWTYFHVSDWQEGTTVYGEGKRKGHMNWIWEIPVRPGIVSVGYINTGAAIKEQRAAGLSLEDILVQQMMKFERFKSLLRDNTIGALQVTSFTCRSYKRVCGPNWLIAGEAASLPDPITGNGVTAALRHAAEGARLILRSKEKGRIPLWSRIAYDLRVSHMGKFFNCLIEKLAYDWPVRDRMGMLTAGDAYTIPAWSINQIYSQVQPDGIFSTALFCLFLCSLRAVTAAAYFVCRKLPMGHGAQVASASCAGRE